MSLTTHIKTHDLFGYRIKLNFNKEGNFHKTLAGGQVSIFIKMIMLLYILVLVQKLMTNGDDEIHSIASNNDLKELGDVRLSETKTKFFFPIINATSLDPINLEEAQKYLKFKAYAVTSKH